MRSLDLSKDHGGHPVDALVAARIGIPYEELTEEKVGEYQLEAFRRTLRRAKERSGFYARLYKDIDPGSVRSFEDMEKLPMTSESDLAGNEWSFLCSSASDVDRVVTVPTTGTTGKQKKISHTEDDIQKAIEFIKAGYEVMNCRAGEKMLILMSGTSAGSIGDMVLKAVEPLGMSIEVFGSVTDVRTAYEKLMDYRPEVVEAVPWHAAALASYGKQFGNPEKEFIRSVNLSADVVPDSIAERLERLWECTVHRHYGSTEMCIFGGVECSAREGYHIRPCDILYEIPYTDEEGKGEIVITTLDRKVMPLIRYKTGDIGKFTETSCACGGRLKRILKVYGRERDILQFGDVQVFMSDIADALYKEDPVTDFEIGLNGDELSICVKHLPGTVFDEERIKYELYSLSSLKKALDAGLCKLDLTAAESSGFASGYDLKKNVHKIGN
ncbi:MAG: phenylacetate--CoA ligase family protein [Firmicutes bacterium]|nr:phenylacetate--CoA ligase family protein [Bacillota bacterium]